MKIILAKDEEESPYILTCSELADLGEVPDDIVPDLIEEIKALVAKRVSDAEALDACIEALRRES